MTKIAPSILAADFGRLAEEIAAVGSADWLHVDVMDGHFVPNLSIGLPIVEAAKAAVKDTSKLPVDVHLMISNPELYIEQYREAGADHILVHQEACPHLHAVLQDIRKAGARPGVVLNPGTSFDLIEPVLDLVEIVLIMSVNPGFGGQAFIDSSLGKIEQAARRRGERGLAYEIEVDGGIKVQNAGRVVSAGADVLVVGTGIFGQPDYPPTIDELRRSRAD